MMPEFGITQHQSTLMVLAIPVALIGGSVLAITINLITPTYRKILSLFKEVASI